VNHAYADGLSGHQYRKPTRTRSKPQVALFGGGPLTTYPFAIGGTFVI
jgi:hypothetical protein